MTAVRLTSLEQLDQLVADSDSHPVVLFKHSTRCEVSSWAHDVLDRFLEGLPEGKAQAAVVYVVEDRPVSNAVSDRFDVPHQSPQALVLYRGRVVWHESQYRIDARCLAQALAGVA